MLVFFFFFFTNSFKTADESRHLFALSTLPWPSNNSRLSPSPVVHDGQYRAMFTTIGSVLRRDFADGYIWGGEREPARTACFTVG